MFATHPIVLDMLIAARDTRIPGVLTVSHPLDYIRRRRFAIDTRARGRR